MAMSKPTSRPARIWRRFTRKWEIQRPLSAGRKKRRARSALALVEHAAAVQETSYLGPPWSIAWTRARAELALNRRAQARADLRSAAAAFRTWSAGVAPADAIGIRTAREFHYMYDLLIEQDMAAPGGSALEAFQINE